MNWMMKTLFGLWCLTTSSIIAVVAAVLFNANETVAQFLRGLSVAFMLGFCVALFVLGIYAMLTARDE